MTAYEIHVGDCLESLRRMPEKSMHCCVTSPPYFGLRDYGVDGQIGLEPTPDEFVQALVAVFREVRRVLRDDGTLWLNLGDSYMKKQRLMIPARVALALQADGWWLRSEIVWNKPNATPTGVKDRPTDCHEFVYLLSKSQSYFYDIDAIREPHKEESIARAKTGWKNGAFKGRQSVSWDDRKSISDTQDDRVGEFLNPKGRNRRTVWSVTVSSFKGAHFATFPPALIEPCILAGCPAGGTVLDPFGGSGTTAGVALALGRNAILCELSPEYAELVPGRVESILAAYGKPKRKKREDPPASDNDNQIHMDEVWHAVTGSIPGGPAVE